MNPDLRPGALAKPRRGDYRNEVRDRQNTRRTSERKVMDKARRRDSGCRWPRCDCKARKLLVEVCHERHRGMGGNPKLDRTTTDKLISFCIVRHDDWDQGRIAVVPQDRVIGFDGPADFYVNVNGRLELYASEKVIGVSSTRDGR